VGALRDNKSNIGCETKKETPVISKIDEEGQIIFKEISKWQQYLISTMWIITSFFISLNFLIIRVVKKDYIYIVEQNCFWFVIFLVLCFTEWMLSISLLIITLNLDELVENQNRKLTIIDFTNALKFKWPDLLPWQKTPRAIIKPWGIVNSVFFLAFALIWWKLLYN